MIMDMKSLSPNFTAKFSGMKPQVKYGLLIGLASFIIFVVSTYVPEDRRSLLNYTGIFIMAFGVYFAMKETRDHAGILPYGRALGLGTLTALIAGVSDGILSYIFCKFINHGFIIDLRTRVMDIVDKSGNQNNAEQVTMFKKMLPVIISPGSQAVGDIIWLVFIGFIISLIVAAILKKDQTGDQLQQF
jgi:hypothetical protein